MLAYTSYLHQDRFAVFGIWGGPVFGSTIATKIPNFLENQRLWRLHSRKDNLRRSGAWERAHDGTAAHLVDRLNTYRRARAEVGFIGCNHRWHDALQELIFLGGGDNKGQTRSNGLRYLVMPRFSRV